MSEDLLVDCYDYNPHTYMVEVPYNDYFDMKDKCKENKQIKDQLQQKENIIKEVREEVRIYEEQSNDGATNELDNYVFVQRLKNVLDKGE